MNHNVTEDPDVMCKVQRSTKEEQTASPTGPNEAVCLATLLLL